MTFTILIFGYRKPGTTPLQFRTHMETKHTPLIKSLTGPHFPQSNTRRYIHRTDTTEGTKVGGPANPHNPATLFAGSQADVDYDSFSELTFEDEEEFRGFMGKLSEPQAVEKRREDAEEFLDPGRTIIVRVGEIVTSCRE